MVSAHIYLNARIFEWNPHVNVWKSMEFEPLNPETMLLKKKILLCPLFPHRFLAHSRTHPVLLSVQSTERGQRGSMSVRQVVTQMMTNWPPLRSPPNQVQTRLSCTHGSCKWRSMALRWGSRSLGWVPHSQHSVSATRTWELLIVT